MKAARWRGRCWVQPRPWPAVGRGWNPLSLMSFAAASAVSPGPTAALPGGAVGGAQPAKGAATIFDALLSGAVQDANPAPASPSSAPASLPLSVAVNDGQAAEVSSPQTLVGLGDAVLQRVSAPLAGPVLKEATSAPNSPAAAVKPAKAAATAQASPVAEAVQTPPGLSPALVSTTPSAPAVSDDDDGKAGVQKDEAAGQAAAPATSSADTSGPVNPAFATPVLTLSALAAEVQPQANASPKPGADPQRSQAPALSAASALATAGSGEAKPGPAASLAQTTPTVAASPDTALQSGPAPSPGPIEAQAAVQPSRQADPDASPSTISPPTAQTSLTAAALTQVEASAAPQTKGAGADAAARPLRTGTVSSTRASSSPSPTAASAAAAASGKFNDALSSASAPDGATSGRGSGSASAHDPRGAGGSAALAAASAPTAGLGASDTPAQVAGQFSAAIYATGAGESQAEAPVPAQATVANLSAQIVNQSGGKTSRFDLQLDPMGLGRVDVAVQIDAKGRASASLSFEKSDSASLLQSHADALSDALTQAGLSVAPGAISFNHARTDDAAQASAGTQAFAHQAASGASGPSGQGLGQGSGQSLAQGFSQSFSQGAGGQGSGGQDRAPPTFGLTGSQAFDAASDAAAAADQHLAAYRTLAPRGLDIRI